MGGRDVEEVRVSIYPNAIKLAGLKIPKNQDETKFSIQYTLARALLPGSYSIADMNPPRLTPEVLSLIERTILIPDESMEDRAQGVRGARVEVLLKDGTVLKETVLVPRGDPENPLTRGDILRKLRVCAGNRAEMEDLAALEKAIEAIGGLAPFQNPMALVH